MGTGIWNQLGQSGIEDVDLVLQLGQELGGPPPDQFRNPIAGKQVTTVTGRIDPPDEPFFIPNKNPGPWSIGQHGRGRLQRTRGGVLWEMGNGERVRRNGNDVECRQLPADCTAPTGYPPKAWTGRF